MVLDKYRIIVLVQSGPSTLFEIDQVRLDLQRLCLSRFDLLLGGLYARLHCSNLHVQRLVTLLHFLPDCTIGDALKSWPHAHDRHRLSVDLVINVCAHVLHQYSVNAIQGLAKVKFFACILWRCILWSRAPHIERV